MSTFRTSLLLCSRHTRTLGVALLGCLLMVAGLTLAEETVPFPTLPAGAGEISPKAAKTFTAAESGLKYRILRAGTGAKPTPQQKVVVNYHGWLFNGRVFDSSYARGMPITFGLNQVIKGWTEGMQLVGKGGMIELEIPGYLGYGLQGQPGSGIPPNATLHFLVELIDVMD
ncbi:MAG: FKBP-type peptidyl-prolyl cis-trans isomerase [Prosthecobacter sp.]|uniref:FKBP-type peptidyl-prolyl cis-trans isomerase n=1 Tax=Prosthecobacter sp. TaxID=1965333 RepID=UPI0025D158CB|nr:FKBP-type peptidyl-prolyl cis-trans isomerase [Prosthecobacter sp.]MCF7788065.1 FKBP-type peptidyl-prolyl cis-trans isomerase [Prosthecobacter sp.]